MKKIKSVYVLALFLIILVLGFLGFILAQTGSSTSNIPSVCNGLEERDLEICVEAYNLGKDFKEKIENKQILAEGLSKVFKDEKSRNVFREGLKESGGDGENFLIKLLAEHWADKNEKKEFIFSDEIKNSFWNDVFKDDNGRNDFLRLLLEKRIKEIRKKAGYSERETLIKEVNIQDFEDFKWEGMRLVRASVEEGDNDKVNKLWIDFESLNPWLESVVYSDKRLKLGFDTGVGKRDIDISGGTIGAVGEIISPNGKIIGSVFKNGIKSIKYDSETEQFSVECVFEGKNQTISLSENKLNPEMVTDLKNFLEEKFGSVSDENKKIVEGILENLDNFGINFEGKKSEKYHIPMNNQLNVLFISEKHKQDSNLREVIKIDYDGNMLPNIELLNGAHLASLDYNGDVDAVYSQMTSKNKLGYSDFSNKDVGILDDEDSAKLIFDIDGTFIAGKNTKGILYHGAKYKGSFRTSTTDMVNVNVIRNGFLDKNLINRLIESDKEGSKERFGKLLDVLLEDEKFFERALAGENIDEVALISDILQKQLSDPYLGAELKKQIEKAQIIVDSQVKILGDELLNGFFGKSGDEEAKRLIKQRIRTQTEGDVKDALGRALEGSNLEALLGDNKEEFNKAFKDVLKVTVDGKFIGSMVGDSQRLVSEVSEVLRKLDSVLEGVDIQSVDIRGVIEDAIDKADFYSMIYSDSSGSTSDVINRILENKLEDKLENTDIKKLGDALTATINEFGKIIEDKTNEFSSQEYLNSLKDSFTYSDDYNFGTTLNINLALGTVEYQGDKYVKYDTAGNLRDVQVNHEGNGDSRQNFVLSSNGQDIIYFNDGKTYGVRAPKNGNYFSINNIVNNQASSKGWRLDKVGEGFKLYNQERLVYQRNSESAIGIPFLGSFVLISKDAKIPYQSWLEISGKQGEFDLKKGVDFDIAEIEGVEINLNNVVEESLQKRPGDIINAIVKYFAKKEVYKKNPNIPTGDIAKELRKGFEEGIKLAQGSMNSQEFSAHLKKSFASLSQLKSFGVDVPLKLTDSLYVAQHQDEFRKVIQFFESAGGAKTVTFKANSIVIDGRGISGVDSAVYRTVLRSIYEQGMADRYHRKSGPIIEVRPDGKRIEISPDGTRRELS